MACKLGQGNVINGSFKEGSIALESKNPSSNYVPVFRTTTDVSHVNEAVEAAKNSMKSWDYIGLEKRIEYLMRLKEVFQKNEAQIAQAISDEMGKIKSEALTEAKSLSARIDLMINHGLERIQDESLYQLRSQTRHHKQGVLAVIGPYNFPAHLVNAHVIPSLLSGNTVVIKPSEICPQVGEIYAQCFLQAQFPKGVVNMVQGDGSIAHKLSIHPHIDGVLFTGSYNTGRKIQEALLDQPHKIIALELGGKNFSVVMDDAHIEQALFEIIQGSFLTTGQRCTATSRVLVQQNIFEQFRALLIDVSKKLKPDTENNQAMFGPLATKQALEKFQRGLIRAKEEGVEVLLESQVLEGGAFVTPSIYQVCGEHPIGGYLSEELFGPNIALESFQNLDQAIVRINQSPYGLSNSLFSIDQSNFEKMYSETKCGVLNFNRSTNGAYGQMPFGGVNKSGNQRPAGIDAVRYTTYPVALTSLAYGESSASSELKKLLNDSARSHTRVNIINTRHEIEKIFELFGINSEAAAQNKLIYLKNSFADFKEFSHEFYIGISKIFADAVVIDEKYLKFNLNFIKNADDCINNLKKYLEEVCAKTGLNISKYKPLKIAIPKDMQIPRSRAMLDRLYQGNFVPKEKKAPVADLYRSRGAYLASVDDEPLILFDAASQIATIGAGFNADTLQNSYDRGDFDGELAQNYDLSNQENDLSDAAYNAVLAKKQLEDFLHHQSDHIFKSVSYGASGAEANEISFDLCRQHGPGGTRIIAFEGAFHGRTIMALQATYNKEKRGPFMFEGFEAHFVPFPKMDDITEQPKVNLDHLRDLSLGIIPQVEDSDSLLDLEIHSLRRVKEEVEHGNICAVIVEPMQCEGGDRYASYRFFNYLRALTRGLKVPLIFDEVQTGFHLGQKFFWHQQFDLKDANGKRDYPDCISLGKKAQLGIVMSVWDNHRDYSPHVIQLKRGLLQAKVITTSMAITTEAQAKKELKRLQENFPDLVQNTRACGFAFAFDMPTSKLANDLINQRFERGFMAYIAGEKTLRFRLNMTTGEQIINSLFKKLFVALVDMQEGHSFKRTAVPIINDEDDLVQLGEVELIELTTGNFDDHIDEIHAIEKNTYEEGRRDSMDKLREWLSYESSLGLLVKCKHEGHSFVGGYIIGGPLEYANIDGPLQDSMRNKNNTFYSANLSVDPRVRGRGLGRILKNEQIRRVKKMKKEDGHERYHFLTGRNRLDRAQAMTHINEQLGAYSVAIYDNQYGAEKAKALYYRLPLKKSEHICDSLMTEQTLDCSNTIQPAFHSIPKGLERDLRNNYFRAFTGSKLTLSNWATPNLIRYSELLRALMPKHLKHSYFTSGRDEVVDKGLRSIRYHRLEADMVIGFSHQWLGNITAAARSLSHDQGQSKPFKWFDWPHVAHPQIVGAHESLNQIQQILKTTPSNKILAFVVELMGEKSALSFDDEFLQKLDDIRKQTSIPLVFVETTSSLGRSGKTLFLSDSLSVKANMVWWYTGGQLGHVFVDDNYFVEKPLTLISTWDGDEISINRAYHYLLAASERSLRLIQQFSSQLQELFDNEHHRGQGCWHGVKFRNISAHDAQRKAKELSVQCGIGFDDWLMVCARSDFSSAQFEKILVTLKEIIDCDQA